MFDYSQVEISTRTRRITLDDVKNFIKIQQFQAFIKVLSVVEIST